ncbi:Polyprotein P3-like protein [Drosera capensis]
MDMKTTFLHGDLEEGLYMEQPEEADNSDTVDDLAEELQLSQYYASLAHEWINPFSAEGGGIENANTTLFSAFPAVTEDFPSEMEYPKLRSFLTAPDPIRTQALSSSSVVNYTPAPEPVMGPVNYPPTRVLSQQQPPAQPTYIGRMPQGFPGGPDRFHNEQWNLPTTQTTQGAMLILPENIGLYADVISRWEAITLNLLVDKVFNNNTAKVQYIENLLGEMKRKTFMQWRLAYPMEYEVMINVVDNAQNILTQIRCVFIFEDPYQGSMAEQDQAYQDLERHTCEQMKDLFNYMNDFKVLAAKSFQSSTSRAAFTKSQCTKTAFPGPPSLFQVDSMSGLLCHLD